MNSSGNISFVLAHNQTSIDSNGIIKFDANRINLNLLESMAIIGVWILLQTFGNGMLIGMILYKREGNGDPLKRHIIDQVMIILSPLRPLQSAGLILTEIEKSTILKQFFRIEIEPKSIFINLQNRQKTEIGKISLFLHKIKSKSNSKIANNRAAILY